MIKGGLQYIGVLLLVLTLAGQCDSTKDQPKSLTGTRSRLIEEPLRGKAWAACLNDVDESGGDCTTSRCSVSCEGEGEGADPNFSLSAHSLSASNSDNIRGLVRLNRAADMATSAPNAEAERLFYLTFQMPIGWNRIAKEKNALVSLSQIDPQRAMDLFNRVENPQPFPGILGFPEDVRADAATHIFPNYWRFAGLQGLPQINIIAKHIGDTGEYPYSAMSWILSELSKSKRHDEGVAARDIFRQAVEYYKQPSNFLNRNEEFLQFLQTAKVAVNGTEFRQALHMYVMRLRTEQSKDGHYIGEIKTSGSLIRFTDENRLLLFNIFPLIFKIDRKWAETLIHHDAALIHAQEEIIYQAAGVVRGNPSKPRLREYQENVLRLALGKTVDKLRQCNPRAAWELANRLSSQSRLLASSSF